MDANVWVSMLLVKDVNHQVADQWLADQAMNGQSFVVPPLFLAEVAGAVARRTGNSNLADATYVAVAREQNLPLVTWDRELLERAGGIVTVLTPEDLMPAGSP